jgi:mitochondrial fission protein ELM1
MQTTWILSDGKAGTEGQAIGLAKALGLDYTLFRLKAKWPWKYLPAWMWVCPLRHVTPDLAEALLTSKPDIIIAGGRITAMPAKYLRLKYGAFTVFILDPYVSTKHFDVVICPQHDHLKGDNVIEVRGALHRLTEETLNEGRKSFKDTFQDFPSPRISVLVGGNTRHAKFTEAYVKALVDHLKPLAKESGGCILMTASRRTPVECVTVLIESLKSSDVPFYFWDGKGANPYMGMLAWGDVVVVTGDSASMAAEAAFTGKPVYIYDVPGNATKFQELHQALYLGGYAKPLAQADVASFTKWKPKCLNELPRVAKLVQEKLDLLKKR